MRWLAWFGAGLMVACGAKSGLRVDPSSSEEDAAVALVDAGPPATTAPAPVGCEDAVATIRYSGGEPSERSVTLRATVGVEKTDAYFLFDTTGSMADEIAAMRTTVLELIETLTCPTGGERCSSTSDCPAGQVCGPAGECGAADEVEGCLADLHVGVGRYDGVSDGYRHLRSPSPPSEEVVAAIPGRADGLGGREALYQSVSCVGRLGRCPSAECVREGRGCPGFRPDALAIVVAITDEGDQCSAAVFAPECLETLETVTLSLQRLDATFVGINADPSFGMATDYLTAIAEGSDSRSVDGEPLVFTGSGAQVVEAVRSGLRAAAAQPLRFEVELESLSDDPREGLDLIDYAALNTQAPGCFRYEGAVDADGDGRPDTVPEAGPGTTGCFDVVFKDREPGDEPTVVRLRAKLTGDGAIVDEATVCVVY